MNTSEMILRFRMDDYQNEQQKADILHDLKRNIRRVIQKLIEEEDLNTLIKLENQNWYGLKELDFFLQYAIEKEKKEIWLYFMQQKQEKHGFPDVEYQI